MKKYTKEKWLNRVQTRSDITAFLTHLTKGKSPEGTLDILIQILKTKKIIGSGHSAFIHKGQTVVCFQDTPIYCVTQNILHEKELQKDGDKIRYEAVGICVDKDIVYDKGGRPVIYESKGKGQEILNDEKEYWRIVSFDRADKNNIIDWTHEREWRISGDFFFDLGEVYVLLPNKKAYKYFITKCPKEIFVEIAGIIVLTPIIN